MIIRKSENRHVQYSSENGGLGNFDFAFCADEEAGTCPKGLKYVAVITVPAGESVGVHRHDTDAEVYLIIKGRAEYTENGNTTVLEVGDCTVAQNGDEHGIRSIGDEALVFVEVKPA